MLFNRQKELIYMIEKLHRSGKTKIQKLMFLSSINEDNCPYDFFPYNYGPYSIELQHDLDRLCNDEILAFTDDQYAINHSPLLKISNTRKARLDEVFNNFGTYSTHDLIKYVYTNYPQYAINSIKAKELLTSGEMDRVTKCKSNQCELTLFTIGYEHKSIDKYLHQLIENNIHTLIDVRANSYSMKREFMGKNLALQCKLLNIEYIHLPEVGIPTEYRKKSTNKAELFQIYKEDLLPQHKGRIGEIIKLVDERKRVALTCFEAEHKECHRNVLAEEIRKSSKGTIPLVHI